MKCKHLLALCLFLAVCLLAGCSTQSKETEPSIEETQPVSEPIRQLTCIHAEAQPTIVPSGEGCVLLCWTDYRVNATHLDLVDTGSETVKHSARRTGYQELRGNRFSDGSFALYHMDENRFFFLNQRLEEVGSFVPETSDGFFSPDRQNYYFLKEQILFCTCVESGETTQVELPYNMRFLDIAGYHPTEDQLALRFLISPYDSAYGTAIIDLESGEPLMLQSGGFQVSFHENSVYLMGFEDDAMAYDLTYGEAGTGFQYAGASLFRKDCELMAVNGSDYLTEIGEDTWLYRLGAEIGACSLKDNGIPGEFRSACWLEDAQTIVGSVFQNGTFQLYLVRPSQLPFSPIAQPEEVPSPLTVSAELGNAYNLALSGGELPENLVQVRTLADELEERYGVKIQLSSQCAQAAQSCMYEITTTDQIGFADEPEQIGRFLNALEQCLSLYPEGFFRQFCNSVGECRIRFLPVGAMKSETNVVGVCFPDGGWYNIALDIREEKMTGYLCHEIWHATEFMILAEDAAAFDNDAWAELNPPGFLYDRGGNLDDPNWQKWTMLYSSGREGIYFIDGYGRTNELEDRARIMEYMMTKDEFAERMMASPAITGKLQWMCDAIRRCFDTTDWEDVRWERFLGT